jgi:hypothetical protein
MKSFVAYLLGTFLFLSAVNAAPLWTSIASTGTIIPRPTRPRCSSVVRS